MSPGLIGFIILNYSMAGKRATYFSKVVKVWLLYHCLRKLIWKYSFEEFKVFPLMELSDHC